MAASDQVHCIHLDHIASFRFRYFPHSEFVTHNRSQSINTPFWISHPRPATKFLIFSSCFTTFCSRYGLGLSAELSQKKFVDKVSCISTTIVPKRQCTCIFVDMAVLLRRSCPRKGEQRDRLFSRNIVRTSIRPASPGTPGTLVQAGFGHRRT